MTRDEYLRDVDWELRDVPWKRRKQLIAELAAHLDETPAEELDSPDAYAKELRESAGLPYRHGLITFLRARRPRTLVIAAVVLVVIGLLAAALAWVESYQPLATGNYGVETPHARVGPAGEVAVTFQDGKPFELGFSVLNSGAFTVRVVDGPHFQAAAPFSMRLYMSGQIPRTGGCCGPLMPFRPFDLPPGDQRVIVLRGTFSHCRDWAGRSSFSIDSVPVTFSFLWRTQMVRVPLGSPFVIQIPVGRRCLR